MKPAYPRIGASLRAFCIVAFVLIFVLMVLRVLGRFVPLGSSGWSDEILELLVAWTIFIGAAELWRAGLHFRVEILPQKLAGTAAGRWLDVVLLLCSLAFLVIYIYQATSLMFQTTSVSPIFVWSRRWWYAPMPLSGVLMIFFTLSAIVADLRSPKLEVRGHESSQVI